MTEITPEDLVAQGFRPNQVDIDAMLAQMAKLQSTVDALNAERGVPIDAVDGHRKHLKEHVRVRMNSRPDVSFAEVEGLIGTLPENSDQITAKHTEALHFAMEQLLKAHPGKELEYLGVLSAELHQMVLNRENKSGLTHDRVTALEEELATIKAQLSGVAHG